jgi:TonB dependent receptor/TonB-dependent Receptor Plug Domain
MRSFAESLAVKRITPLLLCAGLTGLTQAQTTDAPAATSNAASAPTQSIEVQGQRVRNAAGKQTLSGDELSRVPGASGDPMKAVQSLPGVAAVNDASGEPAVRGARPSDNAYYVDFLPVGYLFHLGGFASVFNPDLIRRFDLATAAWSPEYGDVVGAVFDISLRNPRSDRLGGKADFSLLGANVLFEGPLTDKLSFFVAGRRSWFDLISKTGEDKEEGVTYTVPVYTDSQGRLLWTLNADHRLRLDFSTASDKLEFTAKPGSKAVQRDPVLLGNSNQKQSFTSVAATWDADLGKVFGASLANVLALGQMQDRASARIGQAGSLDVKVTSTYLREQMQAQWTPDFSSVMGGSLNSRLIDLNLDFLYARCTEFDPNCDISTAPRVNSLQKARQNLADVYINNRFDLNKQFTLTGGVRVGHDGYLKQSYAEPRLGVEWNWSPTTQLSVGLGRHNQPPPAEESLRDVGNPKLEHLRSNHAVVGITQTLDDGWSWRAEAYAKTFNGYAVNDAVLNFRNGASGTASGLELLVKKDGVGAWSRLSGFFSLSLSRAKRKNDSTGENFPFEFDQPVIASLVGQYKLSDKWQFGAKWSYHTGQPYTPVVGTGLYPDGRVRPIYGSINSQRVPDYHRLDLRADVKFTKNFTAYAELINAYFRKNVAGYSYSPDYKTRETIYQLPTLPSVGLQYSF